MLRILQVVTYMGRGGLETMLMNYYRNIDRTKVQFDFLVHREFRADYDDEIESLGGKIYRAPRLNPYSAKYRKFMKNFFAEHEYTVVHSHLDCMAGIPLAFAKRAGVPVRIAHSHSRSQEKNFKMIVKMLQKRNIPLYATELFACGAEAGAFMYGDQSFSIINNAIDVEKFSPNEKIRKKMRVSLGIKDELVIGHVGRMDRPKNQLFLIDIFKVLQQSTNSKLILVGTGFLMNEIVEKVQKLNLQDSVLILGTRNDIPDLMQAFDVFVFPSIFEGLPLTLIEAQASGLPCVISDTIPNEVKLTSLVEFVSLKASLQLWTDKILEASKIQRRQQAESIRSHGYDIEESTRQLAENYLKLSNKRDLKYEKSGLLVKVEREIK